MGYLAVWKILEEIITEFRKKGLSIPTTVMNDLKSARTMITIVSDDSSRGEMVQKIEEYLGAVEAFLVTEAQKNFSSERIDEWLKRLEKSTRETSDEKKCETRFVAGLPRDQNWIRVEPLTTLPIEKLEKLAEEANISTSVQDDGRLLVYGKAEDIREFVKKMTRKKNEE